MITLWRDLRYALRQLRKSPGFTITAVLTLALGIGAITPVFTLFDQVFLRMLPVQNPSELVRFEWTGAFNGLTNSFGGSIHNYYSYPMYRELRDGNRAFTGILATRRISVGLTWQNQAENEDAEIVSGNYFQVLGLRPAIGRLLTQQDDTAKNANPVVVLGYDYWKTRFAAAHGVVGRTILVNGYPFTILGVAPKNFHSAIGGYKPGIFLPISMLEVAMPWTAGGDYLNNHQSIWLTLVGRLKPGVSIAQSQASLAPLWHSLRAQELTFYKSSSERFRKQFLDDSQLNVLNNSTGFSPGRMDLKTPLIILMSMAGLLVAMCVINLAALLLLRAAGRGREMSMRYALGSNHSRIALQLLAEGGLLGLMGAAVGLALAPLLANVLVHLMIHADPGSDPYSAAIDGHVLLFTLGISLLSSLLFSSAPMLHFLRPNLAGALRQNAGTASKGSQRFRKLAVGTQIALSVMLLGGAGLFVQTLDNLRRQPLGFETRNLDTFYLDPTDSGYTEDRAGQIITDAIEAVRRIPGVASAAATSDPELEGDSERGRFVVQGYKPAEDEKMSFEAPFVTPGYFATLRQLLLAGRDFTLADAKGYPKVAIVNMAFANRYFGSPQNALGHLVGEGGASDKPDTTIVGVVGDIKHTDLRTNMGPAIYRPFLQQPNLGDAQIYVRTVQAPDTMQTAIRKSVHEIDPTLVVNDLRTMEDEVDRRADDERGLAVLATGFSALAIMLAAVGMYGVVAYSTEQRMREIGVRLALGAPRHSVLGLVGSEMAWLAGPAVLVALPATVAFARLFHSELYGVAVADPLSLAGALALAALVLVIAAYFPARRAASIDPMQALRAE